MEKIAIISDIHGNIPALETVLNDIRERGIKRIFCLGDLVGKGPHPEKAVDICREVCEVIVLGNHDEFTASGRKHPKLPYINWHRERLGKKRIEYLLNLPPTHDFIISGRKVRLYHSSQIGVHHRVHMSAPEEEHRAMFTNTEFTGDGFTPDVVGYGDIHGVYYKTFRGGEVLFNAGSVGNPLDEPRAAYVIMEGNYGNREPGPFSIQMIRLPYDIELAIRQAADEGLPEPELQAWEDELRTGRYRLDPASRIWRDPDAANESYTLPPGA
jgi:protein phosphatase